MTIRECPEFYYDHLASVALEAMRERATVPPPAPEVLAWLDGHANELRDAVAVALDKEDRRLKQHPTQVS